MVCIFRTSMQKYKVSFKGQNIYVGIDVHLKTWHVTTLTESGCKYSFSQHADAKELFDRLNKKFPEAHFKSAYEAGFCGFSAHYALTEQGIENIVVHAAGYGKGLAPAIFCCGAGSVKSDY